MSSLFDIVGEFQQLYAMATSEEEQADQVFIDTIDSLKYELTEKAEGYVAVMSRLEMEMDKADEIVKRYTAIRNSRKASIQKMNDACIWACENLNTDHIDAGDMTIKVKNNGGMLPVIIDNEKAVPQNLCKVTIEPDKVKIKEYLADHPDCDFAHIGERGKHIEVK